MCGGSEGSFKTWMIVHWVVVAMAMTTAPNRNEVAHC